MKKTSINSIDYEIIKDYKNGYDKDELISKFTDYFEPYDYVVGDWSYGKLRLKGFCNKKNRKYKNNNDYERIDTYIKDNCAYDCKYFIIRKL